MVMGVGQLPSFAFCREAMSMLMLHYPSRLGNFFLVNAGMAVSYLWQAISLLLPQVTQSYAARGPANSPRLAVCRVKTFMRRKKTPSVLSSCKQEVP